MDELGFADEEFFEELGLRHIASDEVILKFTVQDTGIGMTAEEQEELRKAEERRDRLHQNYLRRKAVGKVAVDYEKQS